MLNRKFMTLAAACVFAVAASSCKQESPATATSAGESSAAPAAAEPALLKTPVAFATNLPAWALRSSSSPSS